MGTSSAVLGDRRLSVLLPAALAVAALLLLFVRLGGPTLADWDESVYAQIAKEMVQSGDWLTTRWADLLFFDKPPLSFWFEGALFQLFGISEFAARAPSALAGVGLVIVTFLLARRAYGTPAALIASVILLVSHGFLFYARYATLDITLSLFSMLAVYGFVRAREGSQAWWLLSGATLGLAVMTKSAAAWLPIAAIAIGLILDGEARRRIRPPALVGALVAFLIVAAPWHLYMYATYGEPFVRGYFGQIIVARVTGGHLQNREDALYYVSVLAGDFYPWVFLLPLGIGFGIADARRRASLSVVLVAMVVLTVFAYSVILVKLPWYMVITYSPAAILVAGFITNTIWPRRTTAILMGSAALVAVLLASASASIFEIFTTRVAYLLALLAIAVAVPIVWSRSRPDLLGTRLIASLLVMMMLASANVARPVLSLQPEAPAILARQAATSATGRTATLWAIDHYPSLVFYSGRTVNVYLETTAFAASLPRGTPVEAILRKDQAAQMAQCCELTTLAEQDDYVYVRITTRPSIGAAP